MRRLAQCLAAGLVLAAAAAAIGQTADPATLYRQALAAFYAEDYDAAETGFATAYRLAPDARFASDAAFKAGEAAFRAERFASAAQHFAHYLRAYPLGPSAAEVAERLAQARGRAGDAATPLPLPDVHFPWTRPLVAWFDSLPAGRDETLDRLFSALGHAGYNAVAVTAYKQIDGPALIARPDRPCLAGAYFATAAAPVCEDTMGEMVVAAHRARLKLIAVLPVRGLSGGHDEAYPDRRWDTFTRQPTAFPARVDLWRPEIGERLTSLARDLARSGPDAIWLGRDLGFLPDEGLTEGALERVAQVRGEPLDSAAMFQTMPLGAGGRIRTGGSDAAYTAWCETRAARLAETTAAMRRAVGEVHPGCRVGVVLAAEAVADPVAGLRDRSLDVDALIEAKGADVVVDLDLRAWKLDQGVSGEAADRSLGALSARTLRVAGKPERAIVLLRTDPASTAWRLPPDEIKRLAAGLTTAGPFGLALSPPLAGAAVGDLVDAAP